MNEWQDEQFNDKPNLTQGILIKPGNTLGDFQSLGIANDYKKCNALSLENSTLITIPIAEIIKLIDVIRKCRI
jgi:hypothetical protein